MSESKSECAICLEKIYICASCHTVKKEIIARNVSVN